MNDQPLNASKKGIGIDDLPQVIYEWAVSSVLTAMIGDLNRRLGLSGIKSGIIPDLVGDIIIRALPPEQLLGKLAEYLELDRPKAASVAREIEERMLRPIEIPLRRDLGVDIKMIYMGTVEPKPTAPILPAAPIQKASPSATPSLPPIYRPATSQVGDPAPVYRPATPPIPQKPPTTPANIPVKINVQSSQNNPPPAGHPFGADSWVNKLK